MTSKRILAVLVALALALAACGSDDGEDATEADETTTTADGGDDETTTTEAETTTTAEETTTSAAAATTAEETTTSAAAAEKLGLEIVSIDLGAADVTLVNNGDAPIDVDTLWFCNFPSYAQVDGVGEVAPGETVVVTSPVGLSDAAGELGIYTSDSFSSAEAIEAYVEWGSADHERAPVAIEAGIWDGNPLTPEGGVLVVG